MRVPVKRHDHGEEGVTAVIVAIFAVVMFLFAGLVVDFGEAFANKRQLQNATDAAALAAVQVYTDAEGDCASIVGDSALRDQAKAAADDVADDNRSGLNVIDPEFNVECVTDPNDPYQGSIRVTYAAGRETPSYFGPGGPINAEADSQAAIFVPGAAENFRPYGLCAADVPDADDMPTDVVAIAQPGQAGNSSGCPSAENGGNWWFMNCPEAPNGGMNPADLANVLRNGCATPASVVTPQNPSSPASLSASLTVNCNDKPDKSVFCLDAETGISDLKNKTPVAAWKDLLGQTIIVPVFCALPDCDPSTVDGSGTGNVYPIYTFTAVTVCGYHFYGKPDGSETWSAGDCTGNSFDNDDVTKLGCANMNDPCIPTYNEDGTLTGSFEKPKDSVRLFLRFTRLVGGLQTPSGCAIGSSGCDGGLRQYALVE